MTEQAIRQVLCAQATPWKFIVVEVANTFRGVWRRPFLHVDHVLMSIDDTKARNERIFQYLKVSL